MFAAAAAVAVRHGADGSLRGTARESIVAARWRPVEKRGVRDEKEDEDGERQAPSQRDKQGHVLAREVPQGKGSRLLTQVVLCVADCS